MIRSLLAVLVVTLAAPAHADDWDGPDKRAHFVAGFGIAANASLLARVVSDEPLDRGLVGFGVGALAGLGKEGFDLVGDGDPSLKDLVWTFVGAAAGALVMLCLDQLE